MGYLVDLTLFFAGMLALDCTGRQSFRMPAQAREIGYSAWMTSLHPKKLLLSKWTAVHPENKEKHFVVTGLVEPAQPGLPVELVDIEAVHSRATRRIAWRALRDAAQWRQGWV